MAHGSRTGAWGGPHCRERLKFFRQKFVIPQRSTDGKRRELTRETPPLGHTWITVKRDREGTVRGWLQDHPFIRK